jgi:hypothetical protein
MPLAVSNSDKISDVTELPLLDKTEGLAVEETRTWTGEAVCGSGSEPSAWSKPIEPTL